MNDPSRVAIFTMLFVSVLVPFAWLPIWLQDRQHKAVLWGMIAAFIFNCSVVCRASLPFLWAIAIANSGLLISHALIWVACGSLRKKTPALSWIGIAPIIWIGLCFARPFQEHVNLRMFVFGLMAAGLNILAILEVCKVKIDRITVKIWLLCILGIEVTIKLMWAVWAVTQPVVPGIYFSTIPGFTTMLFIISLFIIFLGPALVALDKELSDQHQTAIARKDFLTGIGNRRYVEEMLGHFWTRMVLHGLPLSIIIIDVDHFKKYNDYYGHPAGDQCLQALVDVLKICCRPDDIVGRYGGEEFAVLLPDTPIEIGQEVAQRMLLEVRELQLEHCLAPNGIVTISLGVASTQEAAIGMTPTELVSLADLALYKAKHNGRDRVQQAVPERSQGKAA